MWAIEVSDAVPFLDQEMYTLCGEAHVQEPSYPIKIVLQDGV